MITLEERRTQARQLYTRFKELYPESSIRSGGASDVNLKVIERLEAQIGSTLSKELREYFTNEFQLGLTYRPAKEDGENLSQFFFNYDVNFMLEGDEDTPFNQEGKGKYFNILWDDSTSQKTVEKLETLYILAQVGVVGNYLLIDLAGDQTDPELYLLLYPDQLFKMTIRFWEYVGLFFAGKAIFLWEKAFLPHPEAATHPAIWENPVGVHREIFQDEPVPDFYPTPEVEINSFQILADQKDYAARFDRMVDSLRQNTNVEVKTYERWPGASMAELQKAWYVTQGLLDDQMLAFFSRIGQIRLLWRYQVGGQCIAEADFTLLRMVEMLGGYRPAWEYSRNWGADINQHMGWDQASTQKMRLFTISPYGDTLLKPEPSSGKVKLYVLEENQPVLLNVTFEEYIEGLLSCGGMSPFPFFLSDPQQFPQLPSPARFRMNLKRIFPNSNSSRFRKK